MKYYHDVAEKDGKEYIFEAQLCAGQDKRLELNSLDHLGKIAVNARFSALLAFLAELRVLSMPAATRYTLSSIYWNK